jgi:hypothetical protein
VQPDPIQSTASEGRERPFMLQAAELTADGGAATAADPSGPASKTAMSSAASAITVATVVAMPCAFVHEALA